MINQLKAAFGNQGSPRCLGFTGATVAVCALPKTIRLMLASFLVASLGMFAGCTAVAENGSSKNNGSKSNSEENFRLIGIATSGLENLTLATNTEFSWQTPLKIVGINEPEASSRLMEVIDKDLSDKGFHISTDPNAHYHLSGVAVLGDAKDIAAAGLPDPGLNAKLGAPEKGALSLSILSVRGDLLWQGTAQIFTSEEFTPAEKLERARAAIGHLLKDIVPSEAMVACKDPRPQYCTMIYDPVCGLSQDKQSKDYPSGCSACSHSNVISYRAGTCSGS